MSVAGVHERTGCYMCICIQNHIGILICICISRAQPSHVCCHNLAAHVYVHICITDMHEGTGTSSAAIHVCIG